MRRISNMLRNKKGQSLVETALVLPLVLLILTGVLTFGIYIYDMMVFSLASSKAVVAGVGTSTNKEAAMRKTAKESIGCAIFVKSTSIKTSVGSDKLTVNIQGDFNFVLPYIRDIIGSSPKVKSTSVCFYR